MNGPPPRVTLPSPPQFILPPPWTIFVKVWEVLETGWLDMEVDSCNSDNISQKPVVIFQNLFQSYADFHIFARDQKYVCMPH